MAKGNMSDGRRYAKVALAKSNRQIVDISGIAGETINKIDNLSSLLGVTYASSNQAIVDRGIKDDLESHKLHGVISGMNITKNANPRYFDIANGVYYINGTRVEYAGGTIDTVSIAGGEFASAIINASGNVTLITNGFPTSAQLQNALELTAFSKTDANTINKIGDSFFNSLDFIKKVYMRHKLFEGTIFSLDAGLITENTTTPLQLDIAGGEINTPNAEIESIVETQGISAQKMYRISGVYEIQPDSLLTVDVLQYDDGTDLANIPNNKYVTHTVSRSSRTQTIYFTYGDIVYNKLTDAIEAPFSIGAFGGQIGTEVEPLANIVVDQGTGSIAEIIDLRNSTSNLTNASMAQDLGWKDNIIPFAIAGKGANAPTEVNDSNGWRRLSFGENDEVFMDFHVNHDYAKGTDAYPHVHWMPTSTMSVGETVIWEFSYVIAKGHQQGESLLATPTVITFTHTSDGTEVVGEHMVTECSDIDAFDLLEPDTIISCKVKRLDGTYNDAVYGLMADLHYQADRDSTINKAPDFYQ